MEMLVATMIFAIAIIPMAMVFQYVAMSTGRLRTRLVGQYLAKALMEKCVAAKYYNVLELESDTMGGPMVYPPLDMTFRKDGTEVVHTFYQEVDVADATSGWQGVLNGRVVRVRVSWEEKNQRTAATRPYCEYRTYIGENS